MRAKRIVIVGAGLGGLFAAAMLARRGAEVVVCERAESLGEAGAGIQISPNGARLLRRIDALHAVERDAFQPEAAEMRDGPTGATLMRMRLGAAAEARWGAPYLQVHRADLLAALEDAARREGAEIRLGASVRSVDTDGEGARASFEDGAVLEADALIGADGVRSTVREAMFGTQAPRFTGQTAWRAVVEADALPPGLVHPTATVWVGPGKHLVTYYLRRGRLVNVVAVQEREDWRAEDWRAEGDPDEMRAAFAGWSTGATRVLDSVKTCLLWGLFDRPPLPSWTRGRVALLGDSCHPMTPFMAQGAVQAFEDGAALTKALGEDAPVADALRRYERARRDRATRVQETARRNGVLFHASGGAERLARHGPIVIGSRLAPGLVMRRFDWLYGHQEPA
jgi:salicylate hydroxylase